MLEWAKKGFCMENEIRYCRTESGWLREFCETPEMQRLKDVGMNCGCEYTSFPRFRNLAPYSRYRHSVGAARIVWNFTGKPGADACGAVP